MILTGVIGFVGCCIILTVSVRKAAKVEWKRLAVPALLCATIFINLVTTHILVKRSEKTQFLRFFWIAPVSLTITATLVCLLEKIVYGKEYLLYCLTEAQQE